MKLSGLDSVLKKASWQAMLQQTTNAKPGIRRCTRLPTRGWATHHHIHHRVEWEIFPNQERGAAHLPHGRAAKAEATARSRPSDLESMRCAYSLCLPARPIPWGALTLTLPASIPSQPPSTILQSQLQPLADCHSTSPVKRLQLIHCYIRLTGKWV